MRYGIAAIALGAVVAGVSLGFTTTWASGSLPQADLTARQVASATSATQGSTITFTSYAVDLGPASGSLFNTIKWSRGLSVTSQACQLVSPDTPSCEWNSVNPNVARKMTVQAQITGAVGTYAALTVCASNDGTQIDPRAVNNCSTTFVRIISG